MKTYTCACGQLIFFENVACVACGRELGFLPDALRLSSLEQAADGLFHPSDSGAGKSAYIKCQNYSKESVCNWMVPVKSSQSQADETFCVSCRLNQTIPDLTVPENHALWARMETAKRRAVYSLLNLKLPVANKTEDPKQGLTFAFLADVSNPDGTVTKVMTGHEDGLITLNLAEADDATREKNRKAMNEPYRTLLGHFRHEVGHYYWDRLVSGTSFLGGFREIFGDETPDYARALKRYYANAPPADWRENYISAYATSHPWEDWAETWANFMHIQDALEVAHDFGLAGKVIRVDPQAAQGKAWLSSKQTNIEEIIGAWSELAIALNSINRSMGLHDTYPFVLSPAVVNKLRFVFEVIASGAAKTAAAS
jgi:hypothetical protein